MHDLEYAGEKIIGDSNFQCYKVPGRAMNASAIRDISAFLWCMSETALTSPTGSPVICHFIQQKQAYTYFITPQFRLFDMLFPLHICKATFWKGREMGPYFSPKHKNHETKTLVHMSTGYLLSNFLGLQNQKIKDAASTSFSQL